MHIERGLTKDKFILLAILIGLTRQQEAKILKQFMYAEPTIKDMRSLRNCLLSTENSTTKVKGGLKQTRNIKGQQKEKGKKSTTELAASEKITGSGTPKP